MKYPMLLLFVLLYVYTVNAQSDFDAYPADGYFNCFNCPVGEFEAKPGLKLGIGYGAVKEINSKFDVFANLGYNFWIYRSFAYSYRYFGNPIKYNIHLINLAVGGRFHFLSKNNYSLYTGLNINAQTYFNIYAPNFGLTAEPHIGWRRKMNNKHEFFTSIGYDQHLTQFIESLKRPGKVSLNVGFNFRIGSTNDTIK